MEGEPYQTGHNAWLPWKGQQLLDDYRRARGRLEDQSYGRQLPHVRKETKNLSIAVRVALAMQYPDTGPLQVDQPRQPFKPSHAKVVAWPATFLEERPPQQG